MSCSPSPPSPPLLVKSVHPTQSIFTRALLLTLSHILHPCTFLPLFPLTFQGVHQRLNGCLGLTLALFLTHCLSPSTATSLLSLSPCTHISHMLAHTLTIWQASVHLQGTLLCFCSVPDVQMSFVNSSSSEPELFGGQCGRPGTKTGRG